MQTFLPYPCYHSSAESLDQVRLGRQRSEALTLLRGGWPFHLAAKMWKGYEYHLGLYCLAVCEVWRDYGFRDTVYDKALQEVRKLKKGPQPPWIGWELFHSRHRAALLYKDYAFYSRLGWSEKPLLDYVWPTKSLYLFPQEHSTIY